MQRADAGPGLAARARIRDVEAGRAESLARRVHIGRPPRQPPEAIGCGLGLWAIEASGHLHGDAAETEEQQPRPPLREAAVERQPDAETVPVQSDGRVRIVRLHDGVIEPRDRRLRRFVRLGEGQRLGIRAVLDREQVHAARRGQRQDHVAPAPHGTRRLLTAFPRDRLPHLDAPLMQDPHAGLGIGGPEGERERPFAMLLEMGEECAADGAFSHGREQLEVGVLETEQAVRGAKPRVGAAPGDGTPQEVGVDARRGREVAHRNDDVVDRVEHGPEHTTHRSPLRSPHVGVAIMPRMGRLDGKRAIVTGAASGIGRASALLFAAEGAQVLAADIEAAGLEATLEALEAAGGKGLAQRLDVSDEAQMQAAVDRCVMDLGGLDVLFANAGVTGGRTPLLELTVEDWERILRVNLIGTFLGIRAAAPVMIQQGSGAIVCTASAAGLRANAGGPAYSASKAGVISLVQTAANQLARTGVRVNAICPGLIETGMTRPLFELARARGTSHRIGQLNPVGRAGQPEEIARVALFLASDESAYLNGQAVAVDGGLSSTHPFVPPRRD